MRTRCITTGMVAMAAMAAIGCEPAKPAAAPQRAVDAPANSPAAATATTAASTTPAPAPAPAALPASVDLRPTLQRLGLGPRAQGPRGTCSIFTTCASIEFALAKASGHARRLSPEYLNWAAGRAAGRPSDGNFFHNALAGFQRDGLCAEAAMPYAIPYDAARAPSPQAREEALDVLAQSQREIAVRWIVPWAAGKQGVDPEQFLEIKRVLASGSPVAAGSAHSRLLVGYRDDAAAAGGGVFLTEDSALARFDEVTYEFVRAQVNDAFWVEPLARP